MKLYAAKIFEAESAEMEKLRQLLDIDRQKKVSELKNEKEKNRSIFAGLLLRYAFLKAGYCEQEWQNVRIERGEHGKPYIKEYSEFHYSLSHSGEWVICAVDKESVGADIQEIKPCTFRLAKRFYSKEESSRLIAMQEGDKDKAIGMFYDMWSAKESVAKLTGIGIGAGIDKFVTDSDCSSIIDVNSNEKIQIRFYNEIQGYTVCLCSRTGEFPDHMDWVNVRQMEVG